MCVTLSCALRCAPPVGLSSTTETRTGHYTHCHAVPMIVLPPFETLRIASSRDVRRCHKLRRGLLTLRFLSSIHHTLQSTRALSHSRGGACVTPPSNVCLSVPPYPMPLFEPVLDLFLPPLLEPFLEALFERGSQPCASSDAAIASCLFLARQRTPPSPAVLPLSPTGVAALTTLRETCVYACRGVRGHGVGAKVPVAVMTTGKGDPDTEGAALISGTTEV